MSMEIKGSSACNCYAVQRMAGNQAASGNTKKKYTERIRETAVENKAVNTESYAKELAKLVPSVKFNVGYSLSSAKSGKTLTVNPKLLEKMQNDPKQEKETKELIKGVESAMRLIEGINKAIGWMVVYKHNYIDENGKYHSMGYYRNDFMLNLSDKLRKERQENSEKLIEKSKEKAEKKEDELQEASEEKKGEKAEQILYEKQAASIIEAAQEDGEDDKTDEKEMRIKIIMSFVSSQKMW